MIVAPHKTVAQTRVLPWLVVALLTIAVAAQDDPAALRVRLYDVRDIANAEALVLPARAIDASMPLSRKPEAEDPDCALEMEELVGVMRAATDEEYWDGDGVEIRPEESGFLAVRCDEEMHASLRSLLSKLRRVLFQPILIEVHELPGSALAVGRTVLTAEQADELLSGADSHRVLTGRANPRRPLLLESKRIQNRLAELRIQVAQEALAPDLRPVTESYGPSWSIRTNRTLGGALLVAISGTDRSLHEGAPCEVSMATGETAALTLPVTRISTIHASAYLQPGQALLVGSDTSGGTVLCVKVRRPDQPFDLTFGELTMYPVTNLVEGSALPADVRVPYSEGALFPERDEDPLPTVMDEGRLIDWLTCEVDPDSWDSSPNSVTYTGGHLMVRAGKKTQAAVAEQLQLLQNLDSRQYTLDVRFGRIPEGFADSLTTAAPGKLEAELPHRCLATVSASRRAQVSSTWHTPYVQDYDARVASGSSTVAPEFGSTVRGFLLNAGVGPMDRGAALLDLRLSQLSHDTKMGLLPFQHPRIAGVNRVDVGDNSTHGATVVNLGEWTVLRLAPVANGKGHMAIVVRLAST